MRCPHCNRAIANTLIARHFASRGGAKSSPSKAAAARANLRKPKYYVRTISGEEISRHHKRARAELAARRYERRTGQPATLLET